MEWNVWLFSSLKKSLPQFILEIWKQLYPFIKLQSMLLHLWDMLSVITVLAQKKSL